MNKTVHFSTTPVAVETKTRTFEGVAVPYGETTRDERRIAFAPGAFGDTSDLALTAVMIEHPFAKGEKAVRVGRVTEWRDMEDGLHFSASLNETEAAEEIYAQLQAGEISEVSVGVYVNESTEVDGLTTFTSVEALELSLILAGSQSAFEGSKISAVFAESKAEETSSEKSLTERTHMENNIEYVRTSEFETRMEDFSRDVARIADSVAAPSTPTESRFKTFGSLAHAIAKGDEDAKAEYLAYTGGTTDDTVVRPAWVSDVRKFVDETRPLTNFFSKEALPSEGMQIEYLIDGTDTIDVAEQTAEGQDLVGPGKITLDSAHTSIKTYGGWVEWSVQQIERSHVNVIEEGYRRLARRYAQVTEGITRSRLLAAGTSVSGFSAGDYGDIVDAVIDSSAAFANNGLNVDAVIVSPESFKEVVKLEHNGSYVFDRSNGSLSVKGLSGNVFGVDLIVVPTLTGKVFAPVSKEAIRTWEQGPTRLQDGNIINLTSQFSLYGYMAQAVVLPTGIRRYTV